MQIMLRRLKEQCIKKLANENGASIVLALLLFIVCTVIAMTILVAATAAAGRMTDTGKYDQRYYAVTSAANLLKDVFVTAGPSTVSYRLTRDEGSGLVTGCSVTGLKDASGHTPGTLRSDIDSKFLTAGELRNLGLAETKSDRLFLLTCGEEHENLACTVRAALSDGVLTLTIYNTPETEEDDVFRMELVLSGNARMSSGSTPKALQKDVTWNLERIDKHPAITNM